MDRLTFWTDRGYVCIEGCTAKYGPKERPKANLNNAIIRLAAYEDTGLEPGEIIAIIRKLSWEARRECSFCKYNTPRSFCAHCHNCIDGNKWEWRGGNND